MTVAFVEVADRVYVLRYPVLDVNVTLVVGDGAALLVDTLSTAAQAARTARRGPAGDRARRWTSSTRTTTSTTASATPSLAGDRPGRSGRTRRPPRCCASRPTGCAGSGTTSGRPPIPTWPTGSPRPTVLAPTHTVHRSPRWTSAAAPVVLRHLGRGHTAGDLVVHVPDADVRGRRRPGRGGRAAGVRATRTRWSGRRRWPRCCALARRPRWSCRATARWCDAGVRPRPARRPGRAGVADPRRRTPTARRRRGRRARRRSARAAALDGGPARLRRTATGVA